jgi:hypothetical protein
VTKLRQRMLENSSGVILSPVRFATTSAPFARLLRTSINHLTNWASKNFASSNYTCCGIRSWQPGQLRTA